MADLFHRVSIRKYQDRPVEKALIHVAGIHRVLEKSSNGQNE